ncbi:conserved hypothetical protein [Vibrio chagasii]|nr:conserved hypothetical protein [Vibrio chagasii]
MNTNYKRYIEGAEFETFECGIYRHPHAGLLGLSGLPVPDKISAWPLPVRMHQHGLLVIGDGGVETKRTQFTNNYARCLLENGTKVFYITDALSEKSYDSCEQIQSFRRHVGIDSLSDSKIHREDLEGALCDRAFDADVKLTIATSHPFKTHKDEDLAEVYDLNLIEALSSIMLREQPCEADAVVILEEGVSTYTANKKALGEAISLLRAKGVGVVISCNDTKRYKNIVNSFGHYLFFRIDNPQDEICSHNFFYAYHERNDISSPKTELLHADIMDFTPLRNGECHYVTRLMNRKDVLHCFGTFRI